MSKKNLIPKTFDQIRCLCIGPPSIDLRTQTEQRLNEALNPGQGPKKFLGDIKVVNSSNLPKDYSENNTNLSNNVAQQFLNEMSNNSRDFFVIIHDEMHWGITEHVAGEDGEPVKKDDISTRINHFFKTLDKVVTEKETATGIAANLAIVLVSATPFALSFAMTFQTVGWSQLMKTKPQYFLPSTYLPWYGNTLVFEAPPNNKVSLNSSEIIESYTTNVSGHSEKVLTNLNTTEGSAVIRVSCIEDANQLYNFWVAKKDKNFFVINLSGVDAQKRVQTICSQVAQQNPHIRLQDAVDRFLDENNCLIVVVNRFAMGETLTSRVNMYDIRARYSTNTSGTFDIIVQDIGRVAGHGKRPSTVYHSISGLDNLAAHCRLHGMSSQTLSDFDANADVEAKKFAGLLTPYNTANCKNPQFDRNSQVYSSLKEKTILLEAEPQLGKTGVIIALLHNLWLTPGSGAAVKEVIVRLCQSKPRQEDRNQRVVVASQHQRQNSNRRDHFVGLHHVRHRFRLRWNSTRRKCDSPPPYPADGPRPLQ